ncbi:von Willebrand factor type A [Sulfolobus islandicus Y.G.57.14]|jgi:Ca-activated chloride channel family protein|uniref:von Willebrand factor type A n=2 Tax=Saccharolobus islandicus TaxID=43080 RepID=C3NDL1_SACI7|nr:VWA domain-containing protein [Sulfolobus islandicus]ACP45400.1 von Willebrand factor type A [Sulfolobus islandicus Y.G.57.14]ADB86925.1 von Willebrand factor, type A [Sulfolobus islandicus L.D.8.5]
MTIAINLKQSHTYAYSDRPTEVGFVIYITPQQSSVTSSIHYIIMIDNSPSMRGEKLNTAVQSAQKLLYNLNEGNYVTLILFSNHPEIKYQGPAKGIITFDVGKGYTTRLHEAVSFTINLAKQSQVPTKIIMLTDGKPTDKRNVKDYEKLDIPPNTQIITIGIGNNYNERILKKLADRSSGKFYHIKDISELPNIFEGQRTTSTYAHNLNLIVPQGFMPFNYDLPIRIPIVEKLIAVYGSFVIPAGKEPYTITFSADYIDPIDNQRKTVTKSVILQRGNPQFVESHADRDVILEIRYYRLLREYSEALEAGKDATKVLNELKRVAEETRRPELIEETKKLSNDSKSDLSEITRKMRQ